MVKIKCCYAVESVDGYETIDDKVYYMELSDQSKNITLEGEMTRRQVKVNNITARPIISFNKYSKYFIQAILRRYFNRKFNLSHHIIYELKGRTTQLSQNSFVLVC